MYDYPTPFNSIMWKRPSSFDLEFSSNFGGWGRIKAGLWTGFMTCGYPGLNFGMASGVGVIACDSGAVIYRLYRLDD
ncbi:Protein of unknown function [Pyronema omphalodes CBS 100304]|uniref:Uncharacterized protein n=1 Tax=Pyronema omphalodes (strain CBS 100304) TaxID=1076935 RepID=U4KV17_PYROM|nr:Protein of unknown function [Pyronema omphalodes CBS 100304]CCX11336.1 Protein of unknown function [Pyronema omphalodes CBS 100304]